MTRWVLGVALCLVACGGASSAGHIRSEFTAQDATLFDDVVDLIEDPAALEAAWGDVDGSVIRNRVGRADLVAIVNVTALRNDVDLDRKETYRIHVESEKDLLGKSPKDISLRVRQGEPGFRSVEVAADALMRRPFVLYAKWYLDEQTMQPRPHWHLSPASEAVVDRTRNDLRAARRVSGTETVVVHD